MHPRALVTVVCVFRRSYLSLMLFSHRQSSSSPRPPAPLHHHKHIASSTLYERRRDNASIGSATICRQGGMAFGGVEWGMRMDHKSCIVIAGDLLSPKISLLLKRGQYHFTRYAAIDSVGLGI